MAKLESVFTSLFILAKSEAKSSDNEISLVCKEATDAYEEVRSRITIEKAKYIVDISNYIKNVRDRQWKSVQERTVNVEKIYEDYVLPFIKEEKRKEKIKQDQKYPQSEVPMTTGQKKRDYKSIIDSPDLDLKDREEWKRDDVVNLYERLYKINWTAAYKEFSDRGNLKIAEICKELFQIMAENYHLSKDFINEIMVRMKQSLEKTISGIESSGVMGHMDSTKEGLLKLFLRRNFSHMKDRIRKKNNQRYKKWREYPCCIEYAGKCAIVTCLMLLQDPSMSITYVEEGERVRSDTYECFEGTRGDCVAFRVFQHCCLVQMVKFS